MKISSSNKGIFFMCLSVISFSFMHLLVKSIPNIPVHQVIFFRSLLSIIITLYFLGRHKINPWGRNKKILLLRGIVGTLSLFCFFYAIRSLPMATAITISNLIPLFTLSLSVLSGKETIGNREWFFFGMSFLGVTVIKGMDEQVSWLALCIALLAAFFTSCAHFTVRHLRDSDHTYVIMFYFPLVTLSTISPYTLTHWTSPSEYDWIILICIGLFTHVGQEFLTRAYATSEVSEVSNIYYIGIVLSVAYDILIFGIYHTWNTYLGILIILAGIYLNVIYRNNNETNQV